MTDLNAASRHDASFSAPLGLLTVEERCTRCEVLPAMSFGAGSLYLGMPVAFALRKTRELLKATAWTYREETGFLAIDVPDGQLSPYCRTLEATYTPVERAAIRALFVPADRTPSIADFLEADSLMRVAARASAGLLVETLGDYLTCAFQPIVDASTLEIFGYEGLLRTQPGAPLTSPGDIFRIARAADLLPHADLSARSTVITAAAAAGISAHLFINFVPTSIYDPKSCLRSTIALLDQYGIRHDRIVFEVIESEEVEDPQYLLEILRTYRQAGFQVALDDLGAGFSSLNLLHMLRPDFVKLDIALVRDIDTDPYKAMLAAKIIEAARALDMTVIAEGIEKPGELRWLRDNGAHLLQGFYLGRPAAVPASVVSLPA
jgi:EAL domain-containing protein (putative c-di-GMP-specific phosphodiesterase class I)